MALAKLNIKPLPPSGLAAFDVLFNPNTYSIVKSVTWTQQAVSTASTSGAGAATATHRDLDAPSLVFGGGGPRTLTLQLFFDVTEGGADGKTTDVRTETNKIVALTRIEPKQGKPPVCQISWGKAAPQNMDFPFNGVVINLTQNFVMFREGGEPVRANLTVVFNEFIDPVQNKRQTDPDLTTYLVKRGDTLSLIAAKLYQDPTLWRTIATASGIDDPRHLQIGSRLVIPRLT
ncbi:MAG: LysM peptidoglycan-binding domain-containing protein [Candidatus Competibacteraceae bacterium]